jgi:hypothetical protein
LNPILSHPAEVNPSNDSATITESYTGNGKMTFGCIYQDIVRAVEQLPVKCSKVKVKESRNRPGVAQRVPGVLGSQIS